MGIEAFGHAQDVVVHCDKLRKWRRSIWSILGLTADKKSQHYLFTYAIYRILKLEQYVHVLDFTSTT
jgi:hypothetical protein